MNGYYLHSRKIFELYISRPTVLAVCEMILYSVRYTPCIQDGVRVGRGQCLLKYEEISELCGITVSQVRTAIKRFVDDGGITAENMGKKGMLITLLPAFSCEGERKTFADGGSGGTYGAYKKRHGRNAPLPVPDPDASYDIRRAEERARKHIPALRKRER